ncbi:MAG TPA: hypothetical protein VD860_08645 [Azospirillum sp.]|nr:hypothetical protein [Azospirillum sp.]
MKTLLLGVDQGKHGALAFFEPETGALDVHDMPLAKDGRGRQVIDRVALALLLDRQDITHAWVEQVGVMPGEGAVGAFSFGLGCGLLLGILAANFTPTTTVTPQVWKRALRVPADKSAARLRASELLPRHAAHWPLVKHDGRAEAALLALYGARCLAEPLTIAA